MSKYEVRFFPAIGEPLVFASQDELLAHLKEIDCKEKSPSYPPEPSSTKPSDATKGYQSITFWERQAAIRVKEIEIEALIDKLLHSYDYGLIDLLNEELSVIFGDKALNIREYSDLLFAVKSKIVSFVGEDAIRSLSPESDPMFEWSFTTRFINAFHDSRRRLGLGGLALAEPRESRRIYDRH